MKQDNPCPSAERDELKRHIRAGLLRELYDRRMITQSQFEQLMELW
ncbi:MAG: hypothetical protein H6Q60_311 [Oscillospiraceae bacterium]|nr:hypothetical protein [Oscillospiraceae bacterium]